LNAEDTQGSMIPGSSLVLTSPLEINLSAMMLGSEDIASSPSMLLISKSLLPKSPQNYACNACI